MRLRKPKTAGAYGRKSRMNAQQQAISAGNYNWAKHSTGATSHPISGTTRVASGIPAVMIVAPAGTKNRAYTTNPGQRLSTYKKKMESIAKIGNPLRLNEQYQGRHANSQIDEN